MKRFWILLTIILASFSLFAANAEAKRFGGGGSIGKQRTMSPQQTQQAPTAAPAQVAPNPAAAAQPGNKWLGPLTGLAVGAGLGALFASGGLGGAMGSILMALLIGVAVMFLITKFRRPQTQPAMQYAGSGSSYVPQVEPAQAPAGGGVAGANPQGNIPTGFPLEAFMRSAKTTFIRLQAANDRKDLDDIREYTTPEMYAEISMQLQERGNVPQKTDVLAINATLLEVVNEGDYAIASVRMSGQLRENNDAPESFDEVWHVQKNMRDEKSVWLLSGIQQIA